MNWETWSEVIGIAATVAFSVTAVLAIQSDYDVDLIGAIILGLITAVGGGTLRDIILDVPVFWSTDLSYIWVAVGASAAAFYGRRFFSKKKLYRMMLYVDGLGVAMFAIQAVSKVWDLGFGLPAAPVLLGILTSIGGGLMRDTLAGRTTLLMRPELYVTPLLLGCIAFVLVYSYLPNHHFEGSMICILGTFAVRAAAIHWNLSMPAFARTLAAGNNGK